MRKRGFLLIIVVFFVFGVATQASAVTKTWDGGGSTNNWSEDANWSDDTAPGAGDDVVFDGTSTKDATIDVPITVSSIQMAAGYIGTVTQSNAASIQVSGCNGRPCFLQNNGTFSGSTNTITLVSGGFGGLTLNGGMFNGGSGDITLSGAGNGDDNLRVSGGTFTSTSGTLTLGRSFSLQNPGSQFLHNGGTVKFTAFNPGAAIVGDGDHPSITFNNLNFNLGDATSFLILPRVIAAGDLAFNDGVLQGNGSVIEARGGVSISPNFDDSIATLELANGSGPRTITLNTGLHLPKLVVNDANVTINTSGTGTLTFPHQLILNAGVINQGGVDLVLNATGTGGGFCYIQNGGTFYGSSNTITANSNGFGAINVNGGTFNGGSGDITLVGTPADNPGLSLLGGTFQSTSGTLTVPGIFRFQNPGTVFLHNSGTVNFTAAQNNSLTNDVDHPSITFNNVNFNLADGVNLAIFPRMIVLGALALNDGSLGPNGGVVEARGDVSFSPNFDGGNVSLEYGLAAAPRTMTLAVGVNFPRIILSDPNVTVNTSGVGTLLLPHQLIIHQGTFNQGNVDLTITPLDIGGGACLEMSGGQFNGSSHLLTLDSEGFRTVLMTGGTFHGGSGNINATGNASAQHDISINGGSFTSTSGTLFVSRSLRVQNTGGFFNNGGTVVFNSGGSPAIVSDDGNSNHPAIVFNNVAFDKDNGSVILMPLTSIVANGTLWLSDGIIDGLGGEVIEARGDVNIGSDFDGITNKVTLVFGGGANQTASFSGSHNFPGGWNVNKPGGVIAVGVNGGDLGLSSLLVASGDVTLSDVGSGVINVGALTTQTGSVNLEALGTGTLTAGSINIATDGNVTVRTTPGANGPAFDGVATPRLILGGDVTNNGTLDIEGGAGCPSPDGLLIRSSSPGTQRSWSGTGTFRLANADVQDQGGTAPITVFSGTDSGNNGANFTFDTSCPPTPTPTDTPTATPTPVTCPDVNTPVLTSHTSDAGVPVSIPINTTDLTGLGVISADLTFNYDPAVLSSLPANISVTAGTVSPGAQVNYNASTAGSIVISVFDSTAFSSSGSVIDLHMKVIGPIGSATPLTLTNFRYNGGLVCSNSTSGTLTVVSGTVSGRVSFENEPFPPPTVSPTPTPRPVPGTSINATGGTNFFSLTDANGNYALSGFGPGSYTVTPQRADESAMAPNGIFSNDPSLVAQHVVGLIILNSVQQRAADVSGLHSLSSFDAALIAQWIVGITNPINQTGKWKFTPVSTSPDTTIDSVQNYKALLMGDVNGDWMPPMMMRPATEVLSDTDAAFKVSVPNAKAAQGSVVGVPLSVGDLRGRGVGSYQFDIEYDPAVIRAAELAADLTGTICEGFSAVANSPKPGLLKVVVYGTAPVTNDGVFVYLRFTAVGPVNSVTPLAIKGFRLNDGTGDIMSSDGLVQITAARPSASGSD